MRQPITTPEGKVIMPRTKNVEECMQDIIYGLRGCSEGLDDAAEVVDGPHHMTQWGEKSVVYITPSDPQFAGNPVFRVEVTEYRASTI